MQNELLELTEAEIKEIQERFNAAKEPNLPLLNPDEDLSAEYGYGFKGLYK